MERVTGIEPALSAWEAEVLPLNYTREAWNPSKTLGSKAAAQTTRSMVFGQTRPAVVGRERTHGALDDGAEGESGVDGESVEDQSVAECHECACGCHGVGDSRLGDELFGPALERESLPSQRFAEFGVCGEFEEEGVARPGAHREGAGLQLD